MTLKDFVGQGWRDHADDAEGVFARLPEGIGLVTEAAHLPSLAGLIVHVAGEHLGRWSDGLGLLAGLAEHDSFDPASAEGKSVYRSMAVLHHCAGNSEGFRNCLARGRSGDNTDASDEIRVQAIAASALAGQRRTDDAIRAFTRAVSLAEYGPDKSDPAARALAVTGNNLACSLEEKTDRTEAEGRLMLQAAQVGRRFWEVAGTWQNVERAEYRLAMTHLHLGDADESLRHAEAARQICRAHNADAGEFFFVHEAFVQACHAKGDTAAAAEHRERAAGCLPRIEDEGFRSFCEGELKKLDALLG